MRKNKWFRCCALLGGTLLFLSCCCLAWVAAGAYPPFFGAVKNQVETQVVEDQSWSTEAQPQDADFSDPGWSPPRQNYSLNMGGNKTIKFETVNGKVIVTAHTNINGESLFDREIPAGKMWVFVNGSGSRYLFIGNDNGKIVTREK